MVLPVEGKGGEPKPKPRQSSVRDSQLWGPTGLGARGECGESRTRCPKGPPCVRLVTEVSLSPPQPSWASC